MAELTRARRLLGRGGRGVSNLGKPPVNRGGGFSGVLFLSVAVLLDVAKAFFVSLIFSAPAFAGLIANAYAGGGLWGKAVGGTVSIAAGASEIFIPGLIEGIQLLGVVSAMLIGVAGWIFLILLMTFSGIRLLNARPATFLKLTTGFIVSVSPFLDAIPTFTPTIWLILRDERKDYKKELKAYQDRQQGALQAEQQEQAQRLVALQQAQQMRETEATNDNEAHEEAPERVA